MIRFQLGSFIFNIKVCLLYLSNFFSQLSVLSHSIFQSIFHSYELITLSFCQKSTENLYNNGSRLSLSSTIFAPFSLLTSVHQTKNNLSQPQSFF